LKGLPDFKRKDYLKGLALFNVIELEGAAFSKS
jgi:hypothetical protein